MTIQPMHGRERTNVCTSITTSSLWSNVLIVTRHRFSHEVTHLKTVARAV